MANLTKNLLHRGLDSPAGHALPQFLAEMATNPEFFDLFSEAVIAPRRIVMVESLNKAQARGELPDDADPDLPIDLIAGFLLYRIFVARQAVTDDLVDQVVDVVFDSATTTSHSPSSASTANAATCPVRIADGCSRPSARCRPGRGSGRPR